MDRSRQRRSGRLLNGLYSQNNQNQNCYSFNPTLRLLVIDQTFTTQKQPRDIIIFYGVAIQSKFQGFEILSISLEIPSLSNSRCEKPISKRLIRNTQYFYRNPRFLNKILGISIEILGFSFEVLVNRKYVTIVFHKSLGITKRKLVLFLLFCLCDRSRISL